MLVSVAVLTLLVLFLVRLLGSATSVIGQTGKRSDSDAQARMIFNRMAADFRSILRRQDVDYLFTKQAGNDTMYFYSQAPGYFDSSISSAAQSPVALVGYRISSSFQLERLGKALTWDGASSALATQPGSVMFLTYPSGSTTPIAGSTIAGNFATAVGTGPSYSDGTDAAYHVLGDQVYRLEVSFVQSNGAVSSSVTSYNGLSNVSAISVAIALLNNTSRAIAAPTTQAITALPDSVDGTPTLQTWNASTYLTNSSLPQLAASQLRIYERSFPLNTD